MDVEAIVIISAYCSFLESVIRDSCYPAKLLAERLVSVRSAIILLKKELPVTGIGIGHGSVQGIERKNDKALPGWRRWIESVFDVAANSRVEVLVTRRKVHADNAADEIP
jgi:hypothetical protein